MGLTSTQFISYHDIDVTNLDLIEDAWGIRAQFHDVLELLGCLNTNQEDCATEKLIAKIRNLH